MGKTLKVKFKPTGEIHDAKRYQDMTQAEKDETHYTWSWPDAIFVKFPIEYTYEPDNLLEILEEEDAEKTD